MEDDDFPLEPPKPAKEKPSQRVKLGAGDLNPLRINDLSGDVEESGMFMGPGHPIFRQGPPHPDVDAPPEAAPHYPFPEGKLPQGAHPTGARFDPITPFGEEFSGEPDNDELLPPPTSRRQPKSPSANSGDGNLFGSGRAPFFR